MSEDFAKWDASAEDGTPRYRRQSEIIAAALREPGHRLDRLLELMRQQGEKPGVVRCEDCAYFTQAGDCPLHQSWLGEKRAEITAP